MEIVTEVSPFRGRNEYVVFELAKEDCSGGGSGDGGLTSSTGNSRGGGGGGGSGGGAGGGGSGGGRANNSTMDNESVIYASLSGFDSDEDEDDEGEDGSSGGGGMTAMRRMRHREDIMASMTSLGQQWNELDLDTFHHMFDDGSRTASHTMMAPPVTLIPGAGKNEDNPLER